MSVPSSFESGGRGRHRGSFTADRSVIGHKFRRGTIRRIVGYARPYRVLIAVFLALVLLDALVGAVLPLIYRAIIDDGIIAGDGAVVTRFALVLAGLAVVTAAAGLTQRYVSARIGEGLIHDLRTAVFDHVQRMPIAFFSRTQTGSLVSRLNGDVIGAQQAFTSMLSSAVGNVATTAFVLAAMFTLSWQITAVTLVLVPLFVLPARYFGGRLAELTRERYRLNAEMGQTMTERFNVAGALLVKVFGRTADESATFAERADRVRRIGVTSAVQARVLMTSLGLLAALAGALVYGMGGHLALSGSIGVGTVIALAAYLGRLLGPITSLSNLQVEAMTTLVSFERVLEVLDLEPMIDDAPDAVDLPEGAADVEFDEVSFSYPRPQDVSLASLESLDILPEIASAPVLDGLSFRAEPGTVTALVGPSGAGKTTITHLISRLYDVTAGAVRVGGHDVRDVTQASLRGAIGVVSQDAHLFHDTLAANLRYARPDATDAELWAALRSARIDDLVSAMPEGLDTVVGDRGYRLSGGEKQRLSIARLLLKDPRIVILDEATAHLDAESEQAIQAALDDVLRGRTSVVIAHRLSTIRAADQILVVDEGRVVERGRHPDLVAAGGLYATLYRTQFAEPAGLTAD